MKKSLTEILDVRFGVYLQPLNTGRIPYLQVRQFTDDGILVSQSDEFVNLTDKEQTYLLRDGDVLFVGKGSRLFAWCYRQDQGPCVASSIFFVLRPDQQKIYPEYLTTILNAPQTKAAFLQIGSGTNIFSIRKSELGAYQIPILSMNKQKRIAALAELHQKEVALANQLIQQKQNLYSALISKLIK